jgi:hypothetical protein
VAALILLAFGLAPRPRGDELAVATGAEPARPVRRFDRVSDRDDAASRDR